MAVKQLTYYDTNHNNILTQYDTDNTFLTLDIHNNKPTTITHTHEHTPTQYDIAKVML